MESRFARRAAALAVAALMTVTVLGGSAGATSVLDQAQQRRSSLTKTILRIRHDQRRDTGDLRAKIAWVDRLLENRMGAGGMVHADKVQRWREARQLLVHRRHTALARMRASERRSMQRLRGVMQRRQATAAWIAQWGILQHCPVRGLVSIMDDFGVMVVKPGVPVHVHQGNDMMAATGTPIVAPFDGTAVASPNVLGGLAVKVYGELGYVYNAHLSAYGQLGEVRAGTVIGYVGSTGDAGGPHDHFEWHPNNGPAVDPNPYLSISCG
jgi:hypothetical protein